MIKFIFIICSLFLTLSSEGNERHDIRPRFEGNVILNDHTKSKFDSITFKYRAPHSPAGMEFENINLVTDENGHFSFQLPKYVDPCYLRILIKHKTKYNRVAEHFIVSPNDHILINIIKGDEADSIQFSGKGAEKYNLTMKLDGLDRQFAKEKSRLVDHYPNIESRMSHFNSLVEKFVKQKADIINRSGLSNSMKKLVSYDQARFFSNWMLFLYSHYAYYKNNQPARLLIRNIYNKYNIQFNFEIDSLMYSSPVYLEILALQEARGLIIKQDTDSISLKSYYNYLKEKYSGPIKELLITNLLTANVGITKEMKVDALSFDSLSKDAEKTVKNELLRRTLQERMRMSKGQSLFKTTLVDINNKVITTESLKGKVVLIDLWGTGCSWCALFHKKFYEQIYPGLKNNRDFVYLSISTDRTKERWLHGMGIYTAPEYLNVSLGDLGINHPFAKYYMVSTLPFALLIDRNGEIFSSQILKPDDTLNLINEALSKVN